MPPSSATRVHPVRQLIGGLDQHLSRSQGVASFSDDPACILRYAIVPAPCAARLSDDTLIRAGDPIIDVHCWNERVPAMPVGGPDLGWAQTVARRLRQSLRLLAAAMLRDASFDAVRACRARVNFVGHGCSNISVSRIIARMGFEDVVETSASPWARVHDGFENVLIAALVWTHNPAALRREKMWRERRPVYASRARLLDLYAPAVPPGAKACSLPVYGRPDQAPIGDRMHASARLPASCPTLANGARLD